MSKKLTSIPTRFRQIDLGDPSDIEKRVQAVKKNNHKIALIIDEHNSPNGSMMVRLKYRSKDNKVYDAEVIHQKGTIEDSIPMHYHDLQRLEICPALNT